MPGIRINAGNDRNGNPRRAYVLLAEGVSGEGCADDPTGILAVFDEGYRGWGSVPESCRDGFAHAPMIQVTPGEYRRLIREHGKSAAAYQTRERARERV